MGAPRLLTFSTRPGSLADKCSPLSIVGLPYDLKFYSRQLYDLYNVAGRNVSEDLWNEAIRRIEDTGGTMPVYLNKFLIHGLFVRPSRHCCPFGAHELHRVIKSDLSSATKSGEAALVIMCEPAALLSYVAAVARAFPLYSRKSSGHRPSNPQPQQLYSAASKLATASNSPSLHVEFLVLQPGRHSSTPDHVPYRSMTEQEAAFATDVAHAVRLSQRMVDAPCDEMNVSQFLAEIRGVFEDLNTANDGSQVSLQIIRGEELAQRGLGGIYNVGRASADPPALAILSYRPRLPVPVSGQSIAWVGKGIVYDTGGLALKTRTSMAGMKRDCGGAAGVLGAFYLTVKRGFTMPLHALFCLAENAIGPLALRVDDIITLYSGKTVEVNNPDAEGRLVVADGVAFARQNLGANVIIDMCTLTGAQPTTTGRLHAAIMSNDQDLEHAACIAGRFSGDSVFPVIYAPELLMGEFSSTLADFKNAVSDRGVALVSCAGHFIEICGGLQSPIYNPLNSAAAADPLDSNGSCNGASSSVSSWNNLLPRWLHIDMASPVASGERATGYGVALLSALFGRFSADPLLQVVAPSLYHQPILSAAVAAVAASAVHSTEHAHNSNNNGSNNAGNNNNNVAGGVGQGQNINNPTVRPADVEMVSNTPEPSAAD